MSVDRELSRKFDAMTLRWTRHKRPASTYSRLFRFPNYGDTSLRTFMTRNANYPER